MDHYVHGSSRMALEFQRETGALVGLRSGGRDFIAATAGPRELFELNFREEEGRPVRLRSSDLPAPEFSAEGGVLQIRYEGGEADRVKIRVTVALSDVSAESIWGVEIEHSREGYLEWIEFPRIVVPDNLGENGGKILWPAFEGVLVESLEHREKSWIPYQELEYPNPGLCGYYPGVVAFQFLSHEHGGKVLYFGSHDFGHATKEIEYCRDALSSGIRLIQKVYLDAAGAGTHSLEYPLVLSVFDGDWHAAADRYRSWAEEMPKVPRIAARSDLPDWIGDSPVVVTYAVTGQGHHGGKTEPNEYFPFIEALPVLERLGRELDSRLLVLLMHWEGTAPWSPPYVWPPLGGEAGLKDFACELHARGHLLGLYCSGTAWTNTTETGDGTYDCTAQFERENLIRHMCRGPAGEYSSKICNGGGLRYGYDMCPSTEFARETLGDETEKMAEAGVDYIQLLDQNLGGAAYQCYDASHGHPRGPGRWGALAMEGFLEQIRQRLEDSGKERILVGCEGGAAEPYLKDLPVNDLRFFWGFFAGRPVPAYSYLFHEYGCNFMGNQCGVIEMGLLDSEANPENLALRIAHSFAAGDLLTLVLKDGGQIHWGWCTKWDVAPPTQAPHLAFVCHLNSWRRGVGKPFLCGGRMLRPLEFEGGEKVIVIAHIGRPIQFRGVLSSSWQSPDGRRAHFFVNYLDRPQTVRVRLGTLVRLRIYRIPMNSEPESICYQTGVISPEIPALSAIMIEEG